jgi:hypothetical protein
MRAALWFVPIWLLLLTVDGHSQSVVVKDIEIVESGIYQATDRQFVDDPNLPSKTRRDVSYVKKLTEGYTAIIPAKKGTLFGVRYRIDAEPQGATVPLVLVTKFPEDVRDPMTDTLRAVNKRSPEEFTVGPTHFRGYRLEEDWETSLTGRWVFEFWYGERKVKEHVFYLVKPE